MEIKYVLSAVSKVAEFYLIDKPYIIGGIPRDITIGLKVKTDDVDITTNSSDAARLGILIADKLDKRFRLFDDKHVTVYFDDLEFDFSSNYISDSVIEHLNNSVDKKLYEIYSRDFTINTLLQDITTREITDPTGMGKDDVADKIIRTPVSPDITLVDDPRRIYRAVNLAARYGFKIDQEIISFVKNTPEVINDPRITDGFITSKMKAALELNETYTISLLKDMGIFGKVPLVGEFKERLIERRLLLEYLQYND